jgi:hemolysin III
VGNPLDALETVDPGDTGDTGDTLGRPADVESPPTWRGRLHTWAFAWSLPAGVVLFVAAEGASARVSVAIYVISLIAALGTSAAYHRLARSHKARRRMRRLDHSMIYVLIAGTYTPLCVLALPMAWRIPVLIAVWGGTVVGVIVKAAGFDRLRVMSNALYLVLGWTAIVTLPVIVVSVPVSGLALMVCGGIAYTVGSIVLLRRRPDPRPRVFGFHEVWHACTLVGVVSHYAMVWRMAVP